MPGGRPTEYDPETFPSLGEHYARRGLNDEQIAESLGISPASLYKYKNEYPEFSEAIKRGKKPVNIEVENILLKKVRGYEVEEKTTVMSVDDEGNAKIKEIKSTTKHVQPNQRSIEMWLYNRMPEIWRQKLEIKHSGDIKTISELVRIAKEEAEGKPDESKEETTDKSE